MSQEHEVERQRVVRYTVRTAQNGTRFVGLAIFTVLFLAPLMFAVVDDDQLRMSDDYAALVAGIILAVLLIAVVDIHFNIGKVRALAVSGKPLTTVVVQSRRRARTHADIIRGHMQSMYTWLVTCAVLIVCLVLLALWAAIEDHGPARWLAWLSLMTASWGLSVVVLVSVGDKLLPEVYEVMQLLQHGEGRGTAGPGGSGQVPEQPASSP
ncbi:hypothetical protein ACFYZ5_42255 [Streptomyces chartreusis]|uniref:hypothetical protein n=1 Tax=Streptomyces chartreusis TaxID=1969 RepID=UPI002E809CA3|nr:hypothetical protein [Streptomyces chartreusis]WUB15309.1 hypothetical protein OG997_00760 [Streptomyces chartreusis]